MSQPEAFKVSPKINTVVRVLTLIFLVISLFNLAADTATFVDDSTRTTISFKNFTSYKYVLSTIVIGLVYTFIQVPFAIYHASSGRRLTNHDGFLQFEFYGDKVITILLATGVGAAFGATVELKKNFDILDRFFNEIGYFGSGEFRSKLDKYFNMAFASAIFLLFSCICSGVSSVISSFALSNRGQANLASVAS